MNNRNRIISAFLVVFTVFASSALAATGTAEKKVGSTTSVESVSIQGNGGTGTHYSRISAGTGTGTGKLYRFNRFFPDTLINTHNVINTSLYQTTFNAPWDEAFNVVADGVSKVGITTSVVIN